jgi:pyridoxamine 5'-phosphate oxidase
MSDPKPADRFEAYRDVPLDESTVSRDPVIQFQKWFADAVESGVDQPEAMHLATSGKEGLPSGRMVLMKEFSSGGIIFFTNYHSRKGREIEDNPNVAVTFFWKELARQVRITGKATKVPGSVSDAYFQTRPMESQVGAIVSPQSDVIQDRKSFDEQFTRELQKYGTSTPVRPGHWGGYSIIPSSYEFWQGRPSRLHDRIRYRFEHDQWVTERLAP